MKFRVKINIFASILLIVLCLYIIGVGGCSLGSVDTPPSPESLPDSSAPLDEK